MAQTTKKCLIVEDHLEWQAELEKIAVKNGFEVWKAATPADAFKAIDRQFFHAALVDLSLAADDPKDTSGLKILEWLRTLKEGTQSVLITAHGTMDAGFKAGAKFGASAVIAKDQFDAGELSAILLDAYKAASEEQQRLAQKPSNSATELFRGDRPSHLWEFELISALNPDQGILLVETLLHAIVAPLRALMQPREGKPSVIDSTQKIVRGQFWSRAFGQSVRIIFGQTEAVKAVRIMAETKILTDHQRLNLSGFAEVDAITPFETFKSPFEAFAGRASK